MEGDTLMKSLIDIIKSRKNSSNTETKQLGTYPTGADGRPTGNVTVLDGVTSINKYLFFEDSNITSVTMPNSVTQIADYAFQKCTGLQNASIPDKVTTIPQYCFDGCTQLAAVTLPKNLTDINQYAFSNCTHLNDIEIPDDIGDITFRNRAFCRCDNLGNEIISKLAQKSSTNINEYAFADLYGITEVTTKYVTNYYFVNCAHLEKVTILNPKSNGGFGIGVFNGCSNLTTVILPDDATSIEQNMFQGNNKLTSINIPTSLTSIGSGAFYGTAVDNITLPKSLSIIGTSAFRGCTGLSNVGVEENTSYSIEALAFADSNITDESAKNILAHATSVKNSVFQGCKSLINVKADIIGGSDFFRTCTNLKTVEVNKKFSGSTTGDRVFYGDTILETAFLYGSYTTIGIAIFNGCNALKTVYLSSSITMATSSSLTTTNAGYYVFQGCTALEDVQLGQDWNMSLRLDVSSNLTVDSMVAMFNSLKDLTNNTAKTLTLGSTNLAKLTDEQKEIATNKNWTLA